AVDGGPGFDFLFGANIPNTWTLSGTNAGNVNGSVSFAGIESLFGGTSTDAFKFLPGGSLTGRVNGGAGQDTLDYSGFNAAATVNLASATATGTGGIAGIEALTGSPMADTLIGANAT